MNGRSLGWSNKLRPDRKAAPPERMKIVASISLRAGPERGAPDIPWSFLGPVSRDSPLRYFRYHPSATSLDAISEHPLCYCITETNYLYSPSTGYKFNYLYAPSAPRVCASPLYTLSSYHLCTPTLCAVSAYALCTHSLLTLSAHSSRIPFLRPEKMGPIARGQWCLMFTANRISLPC